MQRKSGYVAIIGRPNVGKSTLLNRILGEKISITSRKPQTTRHRILGINTVENIQTVYVDTPGLHQGINKALNRYMNKTAFNVVEDVDAIVFMISGLQWHKDDDWILNRLKKLKCPIILAINKVDTVKPRDKLLPYLQTLSSKANFVEIIPISASKGSNVKKLEKIIADLLPQNEFLFDEDQLTDRSNRFLASEIVREKLTRELGEELPYAVAVEIEEFTKKGIVLHVSAVIYVEKTGQKAIVIGEKGERLKSISIKARHAMEKLFDTKVFLRCLVKIKRNWSDEIKMLKSLGYN